MGTVRVATFNAENLFARFKFEKNITPEEAVKDGWTAEETNFTISSEEEKRITAEAINSIQADVIALQEVENIDTLKRFRNTFLGGRKAFPFVAGVDGNDPRFIDVVVLSRLPLVHIRSYQHIPDSDAPGQLLFSRDCLEVDVLLPNNTILTLFVNHLKSMLDKDDPCNGRANTRAKRQRQSRGVKQVVTERFDGEVGQHPFIVLGDLNDYLVTDAQGDTGIDELVNWGQVVNVVDRLPEGERWTHFFKGNSSCDLPATYHQLDYLLLSKSVAETNQNAPLIERRGLPKRADRYAGPHFDGVGLIKPKASDHCPVMIDLKFDD